ncbi:MAG: L,D-transpeptidase [Pseudomonadota bacterium]
MLPRRDLLLGGAAAAATFAGLPAFAGQPQTEDETAIDPRKARIIRVGRSTTPGVIHVKPDEFALYWTMEKGRVIRYPIGVAKRHLWEPGSYVIRAKRKWPDWTPTPAMIKRNPKYAKWEDGMPGGPGNPLGARALYLFDQNGRDTMLRIHGTDQPHTILSRVSNGCARLTNGYVSDLYNRVPLGTRVHLYPMTT